MLATKLMLGLAAAAAIAVPADAQGRRRGQQTQNVPPGHMPPAGMCRIWIDGVPPGRQPAPTDCRTAVRNQPDNSRIIWGESTRRGRSVADDDRRNRRDREDRDRDARDRDPRDRDARAPSGNYRRDAHGHVYDPACIDNDRNGWCDYHPEMRSSVHAGEPPANPPANQPRNPGDDTPIDRGQFPAQLPAMTGAVLIRVGVRTVDVQNWLGGGELRSETVDANGDGVPEQATWYDNAGTTLQVWRDDDRDGRADSVDIYRNGQRVQVVR